MKVIGAIVIFLAVFVGLPWLVMGNDFALYRYFAPKQESVRRQVFEQTKSYNQGMVQELQNMQFQYEQADTAHRDALSSIILHRAADFDEDKLPTDLRVFVSGLRRAR